MSTARFNPTVRSGSEFGKVSPDAGGRQIRVLLVDDHAVIRQALRMLLESRPELEVVGDAENGRDALAQSSNFTRMSCSWTSSCRA